MKKINLLVDIIMGFGGVFLLAMMGLSSVSLSKDYEDLTRVNNELNLQIEELKIKNEKWTNEWLYTTNAYNSLVTEYNLLLESYDSLLEDNIDELLSYIEPLKELDKEEYLKQYKRIVEDYPSIYDFYSKEEIEIMWRCIETEVYDKSIDCKANVASVILNRVNAKGFANNPKDVITKPHQFAYYRTKITESTKIALEYVLLIGDTTDGCLAFRSDKKLDEWRDWEYQFSDNAVHHFYK